MTSMNSRTFFCYGGTKERADLHASGDLLLPSIEKEEKDEKEGRGEERNDGSDCCWSWSLVLSTVKVNFLESS